MRILLAISFLFPLVIRAQVNLIPQEGGTRVQMDIPDFLERTWELNDEAVLQYQNTEKELYAVIIADEKEKLENLGAKFGSLDNFNRYALSDFVIDATQVGSPYSFSISKKKAIQTEVRKEVEDIQLFFLFTTVESPSYFYKILVWTTKPFEKEHSETMRRMVESFREL